MKKFRKRFQDLSQKAAQIKQVLETAPGKVAEVRQLITQTVGEFQQLKDDFRISSSAFPEILEQITTGAEVLDETGYSLDRVQMEVGGNPRLIVHLNREEETSASTLRDLQTKHQSNVAFRSILAALMKAEEMATKVRLPGMTYHALTVEIGMMPGVRLSWWSDPHVEEQEEAQRVEPSSPAPQLSAPVASGPAPSMPSFPGPSSFFERRTATPAPAAETRRSEAQSESVLAPAPAAKQSGTADKPSPGASPGGWGRDALDRFKKMPHFSKYSR
jgi:hypothetical protein